MKSRVQDFVLLLEEFFFIPYEDSSHSGFDLSWGQWKPILCITLVSHKIVLVELSSPSYFCCQ